jgi:hypothetical protein
MVADSAFSLVCERNLLHRYSAFGLGIRSDLQLPEMARDLSEATLDGGAVPEITIDEGSHHDWPAIEATPIATTPSQHLPQSFFASPAEVVAPELIGCLPVKRQADGDLLWGVIVETEAYSQDDPACHGYRRRSLSNEGLQANWA